MGLRGRTRPLAHRGPAVARGCRRKRDPHTTLAGLTNDYSATPLPQKLGITEESRVAVIGAPEGFAASLGITPFRRGTLDVAILFATRKGELARSFTSLVRRLAPAAGLWVAWPKRSAEVETDLSFETVQQVGLRAGLVDNKSCSIDQTWQALRFVIRRADR